MYKILTIPDHICDLPEASKFVRGTTVECQSEYFQMGKMRPCNKVWRRTEKFFSKRPYWSDDWGGW